MTRNVSFLLLNRGDGGLSWYQDSPKSSDQTLIKEIVTDTADTDIFEM